MWFIACPWIGRMSVASWQLRLGVDVGGVGWPRGSEAHGPPKVREAWGGRDVPFSGEEVMMTGSLLCCWRRSGVAAACKTNLVL